MPFSISFPHKFVKIEILIFSLKKDKLRLVKEAKKDNANCDAGGYRIMVIISVFQTDDAGSIPATRSSRSFSEGWLTPIMVNVC